MKMHTLMVSRWTENVSGHDYLDAVVMQPDEAAVSFAAGQEFIDVPPGADFEEFVEELADHEGRTVWCVIEQDEDETPYEAWRRTFSG